MEWIKLNAEGEIEFVSEEVKLVPEVQALLTLKYNKGPKDMDGRKKYRAMNELKYMYLAYSPKSPYKDYYEKERFEEARVDCGLVKEWKEPEELKALIPKYLKGTVSKVTRSLGTAERFLEKFEIYLNGIDLNERKASGDTVHDPKNIMMTLKQLPDFLNTIQDLERQARMDTIATPKTKGDHELGWMAMDKRSTKKKVEKEEDEEDNG